MLHGFKNSILLNDHCFIHFDLYASVELQVDNNKLRSSDHSHQKILICFLHFVKNLQSFAYFFDQEDYKHLSAHVPELGNFAKLSAVVRVKADLDNFDVIVLKIKRKTRVILNMIYTFSKT